MKKVLFILIGILCAVSAGAAKYGTLYRGSGRGVIYTMSSSHSTVASAGMAPAPVAAMGSASRGAGSSRSRGVSSTMGSVSVAMPVAAPSKGIYTAATAVSGGVTTYDKAPLKPRGGIRNASWPDNPPGSPDCGCHWVESGEEDTYVCPICGCTWNEYDDTGKEHCHCVDESGYCWCPVEFDWGAMVFLMLLAVWYGVRASMREKCTMKENENRA